MHIYLNVRITIIITSSTIVFYFRHQEVFITEQDERKRKRHFELLINQETLRQIHQCENDRDGCLEDIKLTSPRIIAEYRMEGPDIVNEDLTYETCPICLNDYEENCQFARWRCPGKHLFHFDCILQVLRDRNLCPMCRYPLQESKVPIMCRVSWFVSDEETDSY